jgi:hypothetical protein
MQKRLTHTVGFSLSSASTEADNEHQFIAREIAGFIDGSKSIWHWVVQ